MSSSRPVDVRKRELRNELLSRRKALDSFFIDRAGKKILERLETLREYRTARHVGLYAAQPTEVPTRILFERLKASGVKTSFAEKHEDSIRFRDVAEWEELKPGFMGILEPKWGKEVTVSQIDLLLVPGVAFDLQRNRLGRGGGYYDSILKVPTNRPRFAVGLAFDFQVVPSVPVWEGDQPVDRIVTEERVI